MIDDIDFGINDTENEIVEDDLKYCQTLKKTSQSKLQEL